MLLIKGNSAWDIPLKITYVHFFEKNVKGNVCNAIRVKRPVLPSLWLQSEDLDTGYRRRGTGAVSITLCLTLLQARRSQVMEDCCPTQMNC